MRNRFLACSISAFLLSLGSALSSAETAGDTEITFTDPETHLTWARCLAGTTPVASLTNEEVPKQEVRCKGKALRVSWFAATNVARSSTVGGMQGWRLPTRGEWEKLVNARTIEKSLIRDMFPMLIDGDVETWVSDRDTASQIPYLAKLNEPWKEGSASVDFSVPNAHEGAVMLVRDQSGANTTSVNLGLSMTPSRYFDDPATGYTWVPSMEGPNLNWWESVAMASAINLRGESGWRIPSRTDLETLLPKLDTPGYPRLGFFDRCRTTDAGKVAGTVLTYDSLDRNNPSKGFREEPAINEGAVMCLVKGKSPDPSFEKVVARVYTWQGDEKFPISDNQVSSNAAIEAKKLADERRYLINSQKEEKARAAAADAMIASYRAKQQALRKSPKIGDVTKQGLVLQVKGDLVLLQQRETVCVRMGSKYCNEMQTRETGNQIWVRKDELNPP